MLYMVVRVHCHSCQLHILADTKSLTFSFDPRSGFLFVIVINQGFNAVTAVVSTFPREKLIVNRLVLCAIVREV